VPVGLAHRTHICVCASIATHVIRGAGLPSMHHARCQSRVEYSEIIQSSNWAPVECIVEVDGVGWKGIERNGLSICTFIFAAVQRLFESMNSNSVDVIVYPTWSNPPRLIGDTYRPDGMFFMSEATLHRTPLSCLPTLAKPLIAVPYPASLCSAQGGIIMRA
jgi:hypothetical protein